MKSRFYQMYKILIEEQKRQKDYLYKHTIEKIILDQEKQFIRTNQHNNKIHQNKKN